MAASFSFPPLPLPRCGCPLCRRSPGGGPVPTPGITGFSELGEENFAAGSVTGYRWWTLPAPDLKKSPLAAGENWPVSPLSGQRAPWEPGVNEAVCLAGPGAHEEKLPAFGCGCGYWAYFKQAKFGLGECCGVLPVSGVIEGWGRSRIGEYGFRCSSARILALAPGFRIGAGRTGSGWYSAFHPPPVQKLEPAEQDWCEAWMAVIEDRLEETYPGVRLFADQAAMLARFPVRR